MNKMRFSKNKLLNFVKQFYVFIVLALIYIPLIIIVLLSFNGQTPRGNINLNFGVPSIVNYIDLFSDDDFLNALFNSLIIGVIVTPITVIIATITCFGIWRSKPFRTKSVLLASNLTIVNPEAITGVSLFLLFSATWVAMGFNLGMFTVILAHISFCVPYAIVAIYPRMNKMNMNHILASYDLGHSKMDTFMKITVPYLLPAILSGAAIAFAMSLDDFIITNLVNGSFQTIATLIYNSRKGIKAWIVTFGALVVIITLIVVVIVSVTKFIKLKRNQQHKMAGLRS